MEAQQSDKISVASKRSSRSSTASSSSLIRARAKAEAARTHLAFAEQEAKAKIERAAKEAEHQKEKADREATYQLEKAKKDVELEALTIRREAAMAEAEAAVWEAADGMEKYMLVDEVGPSEEDKMRRTKEYITSHFDPHSYKGHPSNDPPAQPAIKATQSTCQPPDLYVPPGVKIENQAPHGESDQQRGSKVNHTDSNRSAQPFYPQRAPTAPYTGPMVEHLAQYLARRDLVSSSLYQFDDQPEHYRAWQSSYISASQGLGLTATEELDLMTKWLGKESGNHVKRLRSVYITNPVIALTKAWERLQECYAAPEIIEKALFDRLDNFPRVSAKEQTKLRELADLLMEVQCAKEDGYLPALSYLDTARGIEPIVGKLPYGLQEKWISVGSKHKEENRGRFPPFEFFSKFVCSEARKRNDPSFARVKY